ncbi:MAG TPA: translation initiation factor IF-3 [bacterium]|nr:translation initiation factor IF-3 [bacterium]
MKKRSKKHVYVQKTRVNEEIKARMVRTITDDGDLLGVISIEEALKAAQEKDLDLVEVAPDADPPVCRIMDYGKYLYEKRKKTKKSKSHTSTLKEIKLRPKIGDHDFNFKSNHVKRFLEDGDKVKATIMFRGREMDFTEIGRDLLLRLADVHKENSTIERMPKLEGRNMIMILAPLKKQG